MLTIKRKMNRKQWKQPKIIAKRYNDRLGFNISINKEEFVVFVMPTQNIHSFDILSAVQIYPLAYQLTVDQQLPRGSTHHPINLQTQELINS